MGLKEFFDGIRKNTNSLRQNLTNSIGGALTGLRDYVSNIAPEILSPERRGKVSIEDLDAEEFDRLARERGYRKEKDYYEEREARATEAEATRRDLDGEPDDRIEDYEVMPLTPEEKEQLDVLYYGVYVVVEEYTTVSASGVVSVSRPKPPFIKKTITVGDIRSVKGLIRDDIYSAPKGRSDSIILIEYTIFRIIRDTGEEEVVETGVDI